MRVLVVHNRYSSRVPSGENLAVRDEVRWLRDAGVDVTTFEVSNDDVFDAGRRERIRQAAWATWSVPAQRRMARTLEETRPDLVHVHNLFPLLSASVPWRATRRKLPVVWTVHNRRVACVIGTNFRDGKPCDECRPGWRVPGIRHGCYGGSPAASALATGATSIFGRLARRRLTAIAISEHVKQWLVDSAGFAPDRVRVKYNGVAAPPARDDLPPAEESNKFLFVGHLSEHKGVGLLLDAWRALSAQPDLRLELVGDGPMADEVQAEVAGDGRVVWAGAVPGSEVSSHIATARAVIVPSTWEEPFGRVAAEALAHRRPVITTGRGGLTEIVDGDTGWITGTDTSKMTAAMQAATADDEIAGRAAEARRRHTQLFSPTATTDALLAIYEQAVQGDLSSGPSR